MPRLKTRIINESDWTVKPEKDAMRPTGDLCLKFRSTICLHVATGKPGGFMGGVPAKHQNVRHENPRLCLHQRGIGVRSLFIHSLLMSTRIRLCS